MTAEFLEQAAERILGNWHRKARLGDRIRLGELTALALQGFEQNAARLAFGVRLRGKGGFGPHAPCHAPHWRNRQDVLKDTMLVAQPRHAAIFVVLAPARQDLRAERDPVEKRLAADLRQMDAVIAAMPAGLVLYAPDGKIQRINPAAEKLFGLPTAQDDVPTEERLRGLRVLSTNGKPIASEQQPFARALRGEAVSDEVLTLDGPPPHGRRSVSASAVPLRGADGKVEAVVATFVEITRLQQQIATNSARADACLADATSSFQRSGI